MTTIDTTDTEGTTHTADPAVDDDAVEEIDHGDELDVFDDVVDPRLRARWVAARRAEGRRRLFVICGIAGVLALGVIAYVIANSSLLGAGSIQVRGTDATTAAAVRSAAHIADGEPLLFLDTGAVARRVERVPTVAHADVSTDLPSTVVIRVTPRVPVAWVPNPNPATPVAIVDRDGRVISVTAAAPAGLPRMAGVGLAGGPGTRVERAPLRALAGLPPALRSQVVRFEARASDGPVLVLGGAAPVATEIHLGSLEGMTAKATAALAVMDTLRAQGARVRILGVQVPDAPFTKGNVG
jgi:cell division protein FtsQ